MRCMYDFLCFYVFLTVFQSYLDDGRVIIKGFVQLNLVYNWKDSRLKWVSNPGPLDQQASALPTELIELLLSTA